MQDLNELYYFAEVVKHGGFAPAGRAIGQPKSTLSRRVAGLEARLGVRLIERSSRRFRVTDIGRDFYAHCENMLAEVAEAEAAVGAARDEPRGLIRLSCPLGVLGKVSPALTEFMRRFPKVELQVLATNRRIDLIGEGVDLALRVRAVLDTDASLTMRTLGRSRAILVCAPSVANRLGDQSDLASLRGVPTLSHTETPGEGVWELVGPNDERRAWRHRPRFSCGDFAALRGAAEVGLGVALIPEEQCGEAFEAGRLVRVFPGGARLKASSTLSFPRALDCPQPSVV